MKILHLLTQTELTGSEVFADTLVHFLSTRNCQSVIVSDDWHLPENPQITYKRLPLSKKGFGHRLKNIFAVCRLIHSLQVDIVHCHSRGAVRVGFWAARLCRKPLLTTLHGRQHASLSKKLFDIYGEFVTVICEHLKQQLTADFGTRLQKIKVLRNLVTEESFRYFKKNPDKKSLHIGVIARSSGPKGDHLAYFIENACAEILKNFPTSRVSILTTDPARVSQRSATALKQLQIDFAGRFSLQGPHSHLSEWYKDKDLILGSGRVSMEALFCGIPLIAWGESRYCGLLTPHTFPQALADNFGDVGESGTKPEILTILTDVKKSLSLSEEQLFTLSQKARVEFSAEQNILNWVELYKATRFQFHVKKWIPALMYHKIPDQNLQSPHKIYLKKSLFEKHLRWFRFWGFQTMHFCELQKFWNGETSFQKFPRKPLLLTFDDGYVDNLSNALPLLEKHRSKANIFLLADHSITENFWDSKDEKNPSPIMSLAQKTRLVGSAFEIGSHGFFHKDLTQVSVNEALTEMKESKLRLEKDLQISISTFAYPFGRSNEQVRTLIRHCGYQFAVSTDTGGQLLSEDPYFIFRVNVFPEDGYFAMLKKTSSWYRRRFFRKHGK